jgi:hypothetical protein
MSRKFWLVLILAASTAAFFWYGARPQALMHAGAKTQVVPGSGRIPSAAAPSASVAVAPAKSQTGTTGSAQAADGDVKSVRPSGTAPDEAAPAAVVMSRHLPGQDAPAKIEADAVALNIRHYSHRFGGNPVGSNAEIVKELTGGNSAGATYLPPELRHLNDQGELIDQWGTAYFFHQNSANYMEVRSAGPDKKLWTPDDVVSR